MTTFEIPDADPADITIEIRGGVVQTVTAPATLSIQLRDYGTGGLHVSALSRDDKGVLCYATWFKEPGVANAEAVL